ncbi:MAG: DUF4065 domain-containing protein [Gemmatimonadetes bacterium]|nr:DUF4065 domain-containing protein [Gemmatimonadota bacterium]
MTTADAVADYLVALAHERGESVNNLKLQKLLYYAQAWHLALHDEPLFPEKFQAWMSGPVIPAIYWRFDSFGIHDIPAQTAAEIPSSIEPLLQDVMDAYGSLDEYKLSSMTYRELPWMVAHRGYDLSDPCTVELDDEHMKSFFRLVADEPDAEYVLVAVSSDRRVARMMGIRLRESGPMHPADFHPAN